MPLLQRSCRGLNIAQKTWAWLSNSLDVDLVLLLLDHGGAGVVAFGRECYLGLTPHTESGDISQGDWHPRGQG